MSSMKGKELFGRGDFFGFVDLVLPKIQNMTLGRKSNNPNIVEEMYYLLAACERCGYYCDYLETLKKLHKLLPITEENWGNENAMSISTFAIESLIYCLYNNVHEGLGLEYDIPEQIEKCFAFQDTLARENKREPTTRQRELRDLYADYKDRKLPVYTVEFLYPFTPILPDYIFDLSQCEPYISLEIKKVPRATDSYTSFKFKSYGLIKPDIFWKGPQWKTREKMPAIQKALPITNMLLLQAVKASPGKMIMPYSIEQVSTASMFQYRWDESEPILGGTIFGTDFTAQWVGGNTQWHTFKPEEMKELNNKIISTYSSKSFVTTFHHATNLLSAGFNLEGFLLLCSSCEGMVYHWCEIIADTCGMGDQYRCFSQKKVSKCDECELFKNTPTKEKRCGEMKPSAFDVVSFLTTNKCISKVEGGKIKKYLSKVRNNNMRNDTVHGANNRIGKKIAEDSLEAVFELQNVFAEIEERLKRQKKQ